MSGIQSADNTYTVLPMKSKFFRLLRYSIDETMPPPEDILQADYPELYRMAAEQALLGVMFRGVARMPEGKRPSKELIVKWLAVNRKIAVMNMTVNSNVIKVKEIFREKGFRCCLLKGQGNAMLYPDPYVRMSGDIDIWVEGGSRKVLSLVDSIAPGTKHCYHHADFPPCGEMPVEVHYRPSFMNNLISNKRLQRFFSDNADIQFSNSMMLPDGAGTVSVPTAAFNRIFQMSHIANHFFHEGIGLRQLLDYYYVLKQGFTDEERRKDGLTLRECGLYKMAAAVMYVEKEVFGLDERYFIVPADKHCGKMLLDEIMQSGNFGFYDERMDKYRNSQIKRNIQRLVRDIRFMMFFPGECLWEPVFRLYHFIWRLRHR